jgi:hypothetical protein
MSKLTGMQIFALLSDVKDGLILESTAPLITAGATAAGTAGTIVLGDTTATASTAAKAGFGAWVAKGGWVALVAAGVAAVGVAVGAFFLGNGGDVPPVGTGDVTVTDTEPNTTEETTSDDGSSTTRELSDLLSLFSAEQGVLSAGEDGSLVVDAQWDQEDNNFSTLVFNPREVAQALNKGTSKTPGAVLLKIHRDTSFAATVTAYLGTKALGRDENTEVPVYQYSYYASRYEYIVIQLADADTYLWENAQDLYVEWLGLNSTGFSSDDRRMTVKEITFYDNIWDAFMATEEKLRADGMTQPALKYSDSGTYFAINNLQVPFAFINPVTPDGTVIKHLMGEIFTNSPRVKIIILGEGCEMLSNGVFISNDHLEAVYLPDSLKKLEGALFSACSNLTRLRIGSGIKIIGKSSLPTYLTDIDYNGTMEQWCQVIREGNGNSRVVVHCLDGDIPYNATKPDYEQAEATKDNLAWNTNMALAEGQAAHNMESTYLTLSNQAGAEKTVLLRWALTGLKNPPVTGYDSHAIFYFDVIDAENGSLLYAFDFEESLSYTREEGSSLFLAQGSFKDGMPLSATLFLTNYGYSDSKDSFSARTTHFRLELTEEGKVAVNRSIDDTLKDDVTVAYPLTGVSDLTKLRKVFTNINQYMLRTYDLSNVKPARLLLVTRPHGDSAIFSYRLAPMIDGGVFPEIGTILDVSGFNFQTLEFLYERFGVYKVLD